MKWVLIICLLLLVILAIIIFSKLKVFINYHHFKDNDQLLIEIRAFLGLIKYKVNVPLIKIDDDSPTIVVKGKVQSGKKEKTKGDSTQQFSADDLMNAIKNYKNVLQNIVSFHRIVQNFLQKIKITRLEWQTMLGTGDAAHTGMLTGAAWTIKGSIISIISHYFCLKEKPYIYVEPHFQMPVAQTSFQCMLHFRIGHAIVAGIKLVKFWKGRRPILRTKPFSTLLNNKTNSI